MSYENLRREIAALTFSIVKEILEKYDTLRRRLYVTDDNFAFKNYCVNLNGSKWYLVVE